MSNIVKNEDGTIALKTDDEKRSKFIAADAILDALKNRDKSDAELIDIILAEIGEELANLKYERQLASERGRSTADINISRVEALRKLIDMIIKKKTLLVKDPIDIKSPRFQKILQIWVDYFYSAMKKSGIPDEMIDIVFRNMRNNMIDWEKEMKSV